MEHGHRHHYHVKIAESDDAIHWKASGRVAIDFNHPNEYAISSPRVLQEDGRYKMYYSHRGGASHETYRIGYAESYDGLEWERLDHLVHLDVAPQGWDSEMLCYPFIFDFGGRRFMLYNGNGYGKSGFGIAVLSAGAESATETCNRATGNVG
jgi:hypothetical protein